MSQLGTIHPWYSQGNGVGREEGEDFFKFVTFLRDLFLNNKSIVHFWGKRGGGKSHNW